MIPFRQPIQPRFHRAMMEPGGEGGLDCIVKNIGQMLCKGQF